MKSTIAVLFGLALTISALGQTVKQGDATLTTDPTEFQSPMVIETVFAPALDPQLRITQDGEVWRRGWFTVVEYHDIGKYTCDGVSIRHNYSARRHKWESGLEMKVSDAVGGKVDVGIRATVTNPRHNHEKLVNLAFEILHGDEVVATVRLKIAASDSTDDSTGKANVVLPLDKLIIDPSMKVRVTMTTQDY